MMTDFFFFGTFDSRKCFTLQTFYNITVRSTEYVSAICKGRLYFDMLSKRRAVNQNRFTQINRSDFESESE